MNVQQNLMGFSSPDQTQAGLMSPGLEGEEQPLRLQIELVSGAPPRIQCLEGNQTLKAVALNAAGLNALIEQGFMRKPQSLKVGALHNWVEVDGQMFRLEDAKGVAELERALNERYVSETAAGEVQNVAVFPNPASPTGFDLQFPASPHGFAENRRRHLNEETVEILQNPQKCRVLRKGLVVTLAPPHLVFKRREAEGKESHLAAAPENTVSIAGEDGQGRQIDLSQPIDLQHLSARELAAVLNHPAINRRARLLQTAQNPAAASSLPKAA